MSDAMSNAARYAAKRAAGEDPHEEDAESNAASLTVENKSAVVESAIQQAMRQGAFDNLPGAGKPLEGLGTHYDPDWWIRQKIERENLTGLGPVAIQLRNENRELTETLDAFRSEAEVREHLEDFNKRVINARRQLQGGPPVTTPTRDIDAEVAEWNARREERAALRRAEAEHAAASRPERRGWFRRR